MYRECARKDAEEINAADPFIGELLSLSTDDSINFAGNVVPLASCELKSDVLQKIAPPRR